MADPELVTQWVDSYVRAWNSNDSADLRALFTADATYRTEPYNPAWSGIDEIVAGWLDHQDAPGETTFSWQPLTLDGDIAIITGTTTYPGDVYSNLWTIDLAPDGRCRAFTEWWMKHPGDA